MFELFFLIVVFIWPVLWLIKLFIYDTIKSKKLFDIFSLRDDVAILALTGKIEENDADYKLLMVLINCEINVRKNDKNSFSPTQYIKEVISPQIRCSESQERLQSLFKNETLLPYTVRIMNISSERLSKYIKKLIFISVCKLVFVSIFKFVSKSYHKDVSSCKENIEQYEIIQKNMMD